MANQPDLPTTENVGPKTKRVADPELLAINTISKSMEELDEAAVGRVMAYLNARYDKRPVAKTIQAGDPHSLMQQRD